ncbi:MAG: hypothetical protein LQ340_006955 [Diploschistes diacapsis]|nr:MAG: hypothetical protein LQ340_006955 [Diploschistes diacapsis]
MPPKRKAAANTGSSRPAKRAASSGSGIATPTSLDSSDEYSASGQETVDDEAEAERLKKALSKFTNKTQTDYKDSSLQISGLHDLSALDLKQDHYDRPLWIDGRTNKVTLETFSPTFKQAQDFLITIAEPKSRPRFLHEYQLTTHSLYAAVSVGLTAHDILNGLNKFLKTPLPPSVIRFIEECTQSFGVVKLVLKQNLFFLETSDPEILQQLLKDKVISEALAKEGQNVGGIIQEAAPKQNTLVIPGTNEAAGVRQQPSQIKHDSGEEANGKELTKEDDIMMALRAEDDDDDVSEQKHVYSREVPNRSVETVTKRCQDIGYPALQEYDFNNDKVNPSLDIDLKAGTKIRDYQEKSLGKMFGNGRAKSGIIVLPCGAGKTLVGITAACTIRKGTVVLCTSSMSVVQWRNEFLKWSNISRDDIAVFTSDHKENFLGKAGVIVTTYSMVTQTRARAHDAQKMMNFLTAREWGLMILDEVHVVPASIFRRVGGTIKAHSKLGLTATLLREDEKIEDLNFLIGPKLYEANWMELSEQGHIARVQCAEVWCPMTEEFFKEYMSESSRKRSLLYVMNPRKFQACQFLIDYHEKRGDKIIVFSDNVYALQAYAKKLNKAYIYGGTPQQERLNILENFQHNDQVNTVFLSKIGDTSLDLPEATCLIQISSHYGSRRQEAQRLGRILRAKRRNDEGFNAFFYSLVSKDTQEMVYSAKRQAFLVDQGYAYKIITHLQGIEKLPGLAYSSQRERLELLAEVQIKNEDAADVEKIDDDMFSRAGARGRRTMGGAKGSGAKRMAGMLSDLSGGQDMAYIEYNKSKNKELKSKHKSLYRQMASAHAKHKQKIHEKG